MNHTRMFSFAILGLHEWSPKRLLIPKSLPYFQLKSINQIRKRTNSQTTLIHREANRNLYLPIKQLVNNRSRWWMTKVGSQRTWKICSDMEERIYWISTNLPPKKTSWLAHLEMWNPIFDFTDHIIKIPDLHATHI